MFFFSSRRRHTRWNCDWSSDVCSSDLFSVLGCLESETGSAAKPAICTSRPPSDKRSLAAYQLLQTLRITRALHRNLGRGRLKRAKILARKFDIHGTEVFLEPVQLCRPRDRHYPRLL